MKPITIAVWKSLLREETGATAIEYALVAGGIALLIVAAITNTSNGVGTQYNKMSNSVNDALTK